MNDFAITNAKLWDEMTPDEKKNYCASLRAEPPKLPDDLEAGAMLALALMEPDHSGKPH